MEDVFVLSAVRTPIGKYGGGLASVPPCDLAAKVVREAVSRAGVSADDVGHVVFGNVIHTEVRDMYISRVAALNGGLRREHDLGRVGAPVLLRAIGATTGQRRHAGGDEEGAAQVW